MGKKKKIIIIALIAVLIVSAAVITAVLLVNKNESYRIIKVYEVEGTVYVQRDGIDDLAAYENMILESGDTVKVENGSMTLKLDEDKYVYVEEQTEFEVVATGTSANSKTSIELKKGAITNDIQNKLSADSSYEVNTPNSTMAVRGTVFRVEISYDEDGVCYTKVSVLDGKVGSRLIYSNKTVSDEEVFVDKGYEVIIYQNDDDTDYLTGVEPIDYSELPDYIKQIFDELIDDKTDTEKEDGSVKDEKSEYTVTFIYNGMVFGTQTVKNGECAVKPSLMPAKSGSWDYDFSKPVTDDITINWK